MGPTLNEVGYFLQFPDQAIFYFHSIDGIHPYHTPSMPSCFGITIFVQGTLYSYEWRSREDRDDFFKIAIEKWMKVKTISLDHKQLIADLIVKTDQVLEEL